VCMIYYLDEDGSTNSWANTTLSILGYNRNPQKLQAVISQLFRLASSRIQIQGTKVVAVPLFKSLNGKTTGDYSQRVEPSALGGRKVAAQLVEAILASEPSVAEAAPLLDPYQATVSAPPMQRGVNGDGNEL
jgi:hypothetical protein